MMKSMNIFRSFWPLMMGLFLLAACSNPQPADKFEDPDALEALPDGLYTPDWVKSATIYEANVRQHTEKGDFRALRSDLQRISDMGINVLWLMPIHPIGELNRKGGKGSYYSVRDYKGLNPEFGDVDDFRTLVQEAHRQDMYVIIDWVANHTSFDHVWTKDHMDWYNLTEDGKLQMPEGTDWSDVADLNYDNADMRAAMIDAMAYWVREFDIDGFRCDVASYVPTDFWNTAVDTLRSIKRDIFMLAEAETPELHEKAFNAGYAWEWLHIINGIAKGEKTLNDIDTYMNRAPAAMPDGAFKMYFTTNHDENSWNGTVFERFGDGHLAFAALTFTIDGMPLVYSGQEAGLNKALAFFEKDQVEWGDYKYEDFYSKLLLLNRTNQALWNGPHGGSFKRLNTTADDKVYAFHRSTDAFGIVTVVNLTNEAVKFTFENELPEGMFRCAFHEDMSLSEWEGAEVEMAAFEYHVFHKK